MLYTSSNACENDIDLTGLIRSLFRKDWSLKTNILVENFSIGRMRKAQCHATSAIWTSYEFHHDCQRPSPPTTDQLHSVPAPPPPPRPEERSPGPRLLCKWGQRRTDAGGSAGPECAAETRARSPWTGRCHPPADSRSKWRRMSLLGCSERHAAWADWCQRWPRTPEQLWWRNWRNVW